MKKIEDFQQFSRHNHVFERFVSNREILMVSIHTMRSGFQTRPKKDHVGDENSLGANTVLGLYQAPRGRAPPGAAAES